MKQHDLYFFRQEDARKALNFINSVITSQVSLADEKVTFFTPRALNLLEQVAVLQHINTYKPMFNVCEVK